MGGGAYDKDDMELQDAHVAKERGIETESDEEVGEESEECKELEPLQADHEKGGEEAKGEEPGELLGMGDLNTCGTESWVKSSTSRTWPAANMTRM